MKSKDKVLIAFKLAQFYTPKKFYSIKEIRRFSKQYNNPLMNDGLYGVLRSMEYDGEIESDRISKEIYDAGRWVQTYIIKYRLKE